MTPELVHAARARARRAFTAMEAAKILHGQHRATSYDVDAMTAEYQAAIDDLAQAVHESEVAAS